MARFIVISKDGSLQLCDCVRIAKKSLIMAKPVDGDTKVPKWRCFYYDATKVEDFKKAALECKRLSRHGVSAETIVGEEARCVILRSFGFKEVTVKSTRF